MFFQNLAARIRILAWGLTAGVALSSGPAALAAPATVDLTLLHTNDLHSHFRGEKTALGLGGVARLRTAITRNRAQAAASGAKSLLVDGGDWSEGNIYYNEGAGRETLRMMDSLGYDVAVVGNHDWLNGAATLMSIIDQANLSLSLVASNIETSDYDREDEFRRRIPPYVIRDVGGAKVAFIGLLTYEFIYDSFLKPIKITEPFAATRELARTLRKSVDAVIVISHNSIKLNQGVLAAAPEVDLVIGAHDHVKLTQPVIVNRAGAKPAWIVETGSWGRYLGRVDLKIHPRDPAVPGSSGSVDLLSYHLEQMDAHVAEDPATLKRIAALEAVIEARRGPIFHDHVGDTEVELARDGQENLMGDFATDAYLAATGADLAIDQTNFIYNELHEGPQTTVDLFNSNPGVYNPVTDKAWTLNLLPIRGKTLSWLLNLLYSSKALAQQGALNFSGVDLIYSQPIAAMHALDLPFSLPGGAGLDVLTMVLAANPDPTGLSIKSFKIRGAALDENRTYTIAAPGGVVQAMHFLGGLIPGAVPLDQMRDTGIEDWRTQADYLAAHSPLRFEDLAYGRVHTVAPDLGLLYDDVQWEPQGLDSAGRMLARVRVQVRNTGTTLAPAGTQVELLTNRHGVDEAVDADYASLAAAQALPEVAPGMTTELSWEGVVVPASAQPAGFFPVTARLRGNASEVNHTNDEVTRYFVPAAAARAATRRPALGQ